MVIHQVIAAITSITSQYETNIEMNNAVDQKMEHEERRENPYTEHMTTTKTWSIFRVQ
jgi:hypothetical protein